MKKIKVLEVIAELDRGGAETLLVNILNHIDLNKVLAQFEDFFYSSSHKQFGLSVKSKNLTVIGFLPVCQTDCFSFLVLIETALM